MFIKQRLLSGAEKTRVNITLLRIPTGRRQTNWLFTSVAEDLNSGLPWTHLSSGQSGTQIRDRWIASPTCWPLGHSATLPLNSCVMRNFRTKAGGPTLTAVLLVLIWFILAICFIFTQFLYANTLAPATTVFSIFAGCWTVTITNQLRVSFRGFLTSIVKNKYNSNTA